MHLIVLGGASEAASSPSRDERLIALLAESAKARARARALVLATPERTVNETAAAHQRCRKRLAKLLRLSVLAPDIIQTILRGEQPSSLTPAKLLDIEMPLSWHEQRVAFGLA